MIKKILIVLLVIICILAFLVYRNIDRLKPFPTIEQSPTTIVGFNHIGLSVLDLDKMSDFYQRFTVFEEVQRITVKNNKAADLLFGQDSVSYTKAILKGPNMLLELTQFDNQTDTGISKMSPIGPGMTHTCYQTAEKNSGYRKYKAAGGNILTRGDDAVDLGGYGVTYAYGYDPEGNMAELEQMSNTIIWLKIGTDYSNRNKMWMTQVAVVTPDLERLTTFYQDVLEIEPYRVNSYPSNPKADDIVAMDSVTLKGAWFALDTQDKKLELFEYTNPKTPGFRGKRKPTDLGYTYSYEVDDIQKEYDRLKGKGVEFISAPQELEAFKMAYAYDVDGNVFSIRQIIDSDSPFSLHNMDR